jgi:hypothetical protein
MDARNDTKPDIWTGISFEADEILMGVNIGRRKAEAVQAAAKTFADAYQQRQVVALKVAAEQLDRTTADLRTIIDQTNTMTAHIAKVLAEHANRRPRP